MSDIPAGWDASATASRPPAGPARSSPSPRRDPRVSPTSARRRRRPARLRRKTRSRKRSEDARHGGPRAPPGTFGHSIEKGEKPAASTSFTRWTTTAYRETRRSSRRGGRRPGLLVQVDLAGEVRSTACVPTRFRPASKPHRTHRSGRSDALPPRSWTRGGPSVSRPSPMRDDLWGGWTLHAAELSMGMSDDFRGRVERAPTGVWLGISASGQRGIRRVDGPAPLTRSPARTAC